MLRGGGASPPQIRLKLQLGGEIFKSSSAVIQEVTGGLAEIAAAAAETTLSLTLMAMEEGKHNISGRREGARLAAGGGGL